MCRDVTDFLEFVKNSQLVSLVDANATVPDGNLQVESGQRTIEKFFRKSVQLSGEADDYLLL